MSTAILDLRETSTHTDSVSEKHPVPFRDLKILNFRCFRFLDIPKCGRVNLITGKNNVGKTSLLEAVWVLSEGGHPAVISEICMRRAGAISKDSFVFGPNDFDLFFCNRNGRFYDTSFEIMSSVFDVSGTKSFSENEKEQTLLSYDWAGIGRGAWSFQYGIQERLSSRRTDTRVRLNNQFVFSNGISPEDIYYYWGNIEYTPFEDEISNMLNVLMDRDFKIQRVGLKSVPSIGNPQQTYVRIAGRNEAVPISRLGAGMQHLFNLSIAMVNAVDGVLMIDEIENGIHYSVLLDVWKLVFDMAKRFNIQVFATTHSKECIEAFQKVAAQDDDPEGGMLIRLANRDGDIVATNFDEEELEVMVRRGLEVR